MIRFKQFIAEARMAPLYHATSNSALGSILNSDVLEARAPYNDKWTQRYGKNTVFFSRNKATSLQIGNEKNKGRFVLMAFDQQKLAQRYKIKPIHNWSTYDDNWDKYHGEFLGKTHNPFRKSMVDGYGRGLEFEEIVEQSIKQPFKYVTKIWGPSNSAYIKQVLKAYPHIEFESI